MFSCEPRSPVQQDWLTTGVDTINRKEEKKSNFNTAKVHNETGRRDFLLGLGKAGPFGITKSYIK